MQGLLTNSKTIILAFSSIFFVRMFETFGFPAQINFLHFVTVPLACGLVLIKSRSESQKKIFITRQLLIGIFILFTIILISAILNNAGVINAILSFLLLGEPFIFLVAVYALSASVSGLKNLQIWIRRFCLFHIFYALIQRFILRFDLKSTGMEPADNIQGVFFLSGSGHVVGASVSMSFALYYLMTAKDVPLWFRSVVLTFALIHVQVADAKQVLMAIFVAWILLILIKLKDIVRVLQYVAGGSLIGTVFFWAVQNLPSFRAFNTWIRPEIYGPEGEATLLKMATFRIVPTYYKSFLNRLFGLGPGHTVGRLGGWMLDQYSSLLNPLGATQHEASKAVWKTVAESWLGNQSSMFSPLFGWAGIWGDLGLVGLAIYFLLAFLVWHHICKDDCSRLLLLSVFVVGMIFSQLEEPGYMLTISVLIGLRWHEQNMGKVLVEYSPSSQKSKSWLSWL